MQPSCRNLGDDRILVVQLNKLAMDSGFSELTIRLLIWNINFGRKWFDLQ